MQFPAALIQLGEKPTSQQPDSDNFLDWIYPFHAICTTSGLVGTKAPTPSGQTIKKNFRLDLYISCNFQQIWFS